MLQEHGTVNLNTHAFARYFGSSDWNNRVDRIYMGLNNDINVGGNAVTSTGSANC